MAGIRMSGMPICLPMAGRIDCIPVLPKAVVMERQKMMANCWRVKRGAGVAGTEGWSGAGLADDAKAMLSPRAERTRRLSQSRYGAAAPPSQDDAAITDTAWPLSVAAARL